MHSSRTPRLPIGGPSRRGQLVALLALIFAIVAGLSGIQGQAAENGTLISLGESNSEQERQELLGYFNADKDAQVDIISVDDTRKAMEEVIPGFSLSTAYSSAALTCRELGEGLDVTTINITQITPAMFAMALVTAGVGDANLIVAAPAAKQAQGMTALTGIFKAWDKVNCESAQTTPERQQLALRELALTVEISTAIGESQTGYAGAFVIDTQREIVINNFTSREDITAAIAGMELVYGFTVPEPSRGKLIDLMVDLAKQKIDWSTFSAGWTIEYPTATQIKMRGDGVAIRNAQASATAKAAQQQTATAEAKQTARAEKRMTQTAEAAAALTATALAQPTATATATPEPNEVGGELLAPVEDGQIRIRATDGSELTYTLAQTVSITRDGEVAQAADLKKGDTVTLKVDVVTTFVVAIAAFAPPDSGTPIAKLLLVLPLLLLIPLGLVVKSRAAGMGDPFIVKRIDRG